MPKAVIQFNVAINDFQPNTEYFAIIESSDMKRAKVYTENMAEKIVDLTSPSLMTESTSVDTAQTITRTPNYKIAAFEDIIPKTNGGSKSRRNRRNRRNQRRSRRN